MSTTWLICLGEIVSKTPCLEHSPKLFDIATASVFVCHTAYCSVVLFMLLQLVCVVNHVLQYVSLLPGHLPDSPQETQPKLWTIPLLSTHLQEFTNNEREF